MRRKWREKYCRLTSQAVGRSCCSRSCSVVLESGFQLDSLEYTHMFARIYTHYRHGAGPLGTNIARKCRYFLFSHFILDFEIQSFRHILECDQQDAILKLIFYFSQCSALHVSGVFRPSSGAYKKCKHSIGYCRAFLLPTASGRQQESTTVPDAVFTVFISS